MNNAPPPPDRSPDPPVPRLSGEMASNRLRVLTFVKQYLATHDGSPSYGEIAIGCGIAQRDTVKKIVRRLVKTGALVRCAGGRRALMLPSERDAAIARLRAAGFVIDEEVQKVAAVTKHPLPRVPELGDIGSSGAAIGAPAMTSSGGNDDRFQSNRESRDARTGGARRAPGTRRRG